jgi:hypothetical protein
MTKQIEAKIQYTFHFQLQNDVIFKNALFTKRIIIPLSSGRDISLLQRERQRDFAPFDV